MINLPEDPDDTRMIDSRDENGQEICEQGRLLSEVERKGLVVTEGDVEP